MAKILFVYHNKLEEGYMPLAISVLSGMLKSHSLETRLFDTTFYRDPEDIGVQSDKEVREKYGQYKVTKGYGVKRETVDLKKKFLEAVAEYKPDLIAATSTSFEFDSLANFILPAKKKFDVPVIVGGSHATVAPLRALMKEAVDIVCIGEGEWPLLELVRRIEKGENYHDVSSLWVKMPNGRIAKNKLWPSACEMDSLPEPDWDILDTRHRTRPFEGEIKTYGFWEMSRGCPFNCSYCINSKLHKIERASRRTPGAYRYHTPEEIVRRMKKYKDKYGFNHVQFIDENMAVMPLDNLRRLSALYRKEVGVSYFVQSRPDCFVEHPEKAQLMADMGCRMVGIGCESGNEELRRKVLNRPVPDGVIEKAVEILRNAGIMVAAYYIIGFPQETKAMIKQTIELHRRIKPERFSVRFLQPYPGTSIREYCVEQKYMDDDQKLYGGYFEPILNLPSPPHPTRQELIELRAAFGDII
jgi:anaerobic magnesium-protoporphyrin IX monomethyl ester cyclase